MTNVYSGEPVSSGHNADHEARISALEADVFAMQLAMIVPLSVTKTSDETLTTSTTFQNDDALTIAYAADTTYVVESMLIVNSPTASDFKTCYTFNTAGSARMTTFAIAPALGVTTYEGSSFWWTYRSETTSPTSNLLLGGIGTAGLVKAEGLLKVGGTSGTLTLQWAQQTSGGTTTVYRDSWLRLTPITG